MLIGIDASRAVTCQRTGTEAYSLYLIRAMLSVALDQRFRLYFNRAPDPGLFEGPHVELRVIPFPRLWTHLRLAAELARQRPDVLFVPAHVLPSLRPVCSLVTVHDLGYRYFPWAHPWRQRFYLDWSTRWNVQSAACVLADSRATRQDIIRFYGADPAKVVVAYPGRDEALRRVDDPAVCQAAAARYGIHGRYIVYMGTLQPRKNLARLVDAFHRLSARDGLSDVRLVLAGKKGWLYDDLFAQVKRLGLEGRVLFPGYVAEADKAALLSGAAAAAFPSLHEGFGFPVLEAFQCGAPLVCSNSSSLPELAGQAALLVDALDTAALAAALARVLEDEALRGELVARGYRQAQQFSWQACARLVLDVLTEMCGWAHT